MVHEESSCICNRITNNTLIEGGLDVSFIKLSYPFKYCEYQDFKANLKIKFGLVILPIYIPTQEGMIYCSVFIDCFTRKIVGYSIRSYMRETMVIESLKMAIIKEKPKTDSLFIATMAHNIQGIDFMK